MRFRALALSTVFLCPLIAAQPAFDPVSRSGGGVWLREGGDVWCALSAPALLYRIRPDTTRQAPVSAGGFAAGFAHYPSAWGLGPLGGSAAAAAMRVGPGAVGLTLTRFGSALYSETEAGVAWGASAGALSYGATVRIRHLAIERYGTAWTPRVDLTAALETADWFLWGIRLSDVNRGPVGRTGERLNQVVALAAAFLPRGLPAFFFQAANEEGDGLLVRAGISLEVRPVAVRAGASGSFTRLHAGLDLPVGIFVIGYGVVAHPVLGWSHAFWLSTGDGR
jgi:hypothetical protein